MVHLDTTIKKIPVNDWNYIITSFLNLYYNIALTTDPQVQKLTSNKIKRAVAYKHVEAHTY